MKVGKFHRIVSTALLITMLSNPVAVLADSDKPASGSSEAAVYNDLKYNLYTIKGYNSKFSKDKDVDIGKVYFDDSAAEILPAYDQQYDADLKSGKAGGSEEWKKALKGTFTDGHNNPDTKKFGVKFSSDDVQGDKALRYVGAPWADLKPSKSKDWDAWTFGDYMTKLSDTYEEPKTAEELNKWLNGLEQSLGGNNAEIHNLCQRMSSFMYMYLNYADEIEDSSNTNTGFRYSDIGEITDSIYNSFLSSTLAEGHDKSLQSRLKDLEIIPKTASSDIDIVGRIRSADHAEALQYMGVLAFDLTSGADACYTDADVVGTANYMAIMICLSEYLDCYEKELPKIAKTQSWESDSGCQAKLVYMSKFHDLFSAMIPLVETVYHKQNSNAGDKSMCDMFNALDDDLKKQNIDDVLKIDTSEAEKLVDNTSPITQFYTAGKSSVGIVTVDREAVLRDIPVDTSKDAKIQDELENRRLDRDTLLASPDSLEKLFMETQIENRDLLWKMLNLDKAPISIDAENINTDQLQNVPDEIKNLKVEGDVTYDSLYNAYLKVVEESVEDATEGEDKLASVKKELWNKVYNQEIASEEDNEGDTTEDDENQTTTDDDKDKDKKVKPNILYSREPRYLVESLVNAYDRAARGTYDKLVEDQFGDFQDPVEGPDRLFRFMTCSYVVNQMRQFMDYDENATELTKQLQDELKNTDEEIEKVVDTLVDYGVDTDGKADSYASVTINDFIRQGMALSTTYTPMCTILNSKTIQEDLDSTDDAEFKRLFYSYGLLRKAVYIDTSATSVMDYYNAGGKSVGNTRVATLRDLIESGDNDVSLYVDTSLYNSDIIKEEGNKLLDDIQFKNIEAYEELEQYANVLSILDSDNAEVLDTSGITEPTSIVASVLAKKRKEIVDNKNIDELTNSCDSLFQRRYRMSLEDIGDIRSDEEAQEYIDNFGSSLSAGAHSTLTDNLLKAGAATTYDERTRASLSGDNDTQGKFDAVYSYHNVSKEETTDAENATPFTIDESLKSSKYRTFDNKDSIVLSSYYINKYMCNDVVYSETTVRQDDNGDMKETKNTYTSTSNYTPMMSLAFISCLYRDKYSYHVSTANGVATNNPIFLASDDLATTRDASQWYRNTLLNYALMKNLEGMAGVDPTYVADLDCPLFVDIFGNILTQSNRVVIPAACNATLHTASYKMRNYALGLYKAYGKSYTIPVELEGVASVLDPFFVPDYDAGVYIINGIDVSVDGKIFHFDSINDDDMEVKNSLRKAYLAYVTDNNVSRLNWMAMVNIINEVMRGCTFDYMDVDKEGLTAVTMSESKSGLVAAAKLESLIDSLAGNMDNTLLYIPDFSRMESLDVIIALFLKLLMVAICGVVIIAIYRDAVSYNLGVRTITTSLSAIALTVAAIVIVPAAFQATYYSANKVLLEDQVFRILMTNEEKRQYGEEIGVTEIKQLPENNNFAIQVDWVSVPWYEQLENILYEGTLSGVQEARLKTYTQSPVYNNSDVEMYNDGAYITTDKLFDSVMMDYTFGASSGDKGLMLYGDGSEQTMSYYSPYYVFLKVLTANVNEFNAWRGTSATMYQSLEDAQNAVDAHETEVECYSYTDKYVSGERRKTVGLITNYFTSEEFLETDSDLLHLNQIYQATDIEFYNVDGTKGTDNYNLSSNDDSPMEPEDTEASLEEAKLIGNPAKSFIRHEEVALNRSKLFTDDDRNHFMSSYWYNNNLVACSLGYVMDLRDKNGKVPEDGSQEALEIRQNYIYETLEEYRNRVDEMDNMLRDFIVENRSVIGKVTDETFLKVTALAMAIKYNQLFGVPCANSIELFNMDSNDLLRLCIVPSDKAVLSAPLSYARYVFRFGGTASVYAAAFLTIIMWLGSFIKPICTIVVFGAIFISIFVFRVVLRKPSANIWGYVVTMLLLCVTNFAHALLLRLCVALPNWGLPTFGCILFMLVSQIIYLVFLSWVVGVSLRDWQNLGMGIYSKEAIKVQDKLGLRDEGTLREPRKKNNWEYYNDLLISNRNRNKAFIANTRQTSHSAMQDNQRGLKWDKTSKVAEIEDDKFVKSETANSGYRKGYAQLDPTIYNDLTQFK